MPKHVDELIENPQQHFAHPAEVLTAQDLSTEDKRRILESWKQDEQRLAESSAENMVGGEETELRDVSKVLLELNTSEPAPAARQPSGFGSEGLLTGTVLGGVVGAGAGLLITAMTGPSMAVVAQATLVGLILGGVGAALRNAVRS